MPALDPIDDTNLYPDKDDGGTAQTTATVNADDLNSIKSRISENRTQANAALAATAGAVVDQTASFSLAASDHGKVIRVDSAGGAVVITIPHTLFGSIIASGVFRTTILVTNADEAITIAGSGGITPQYFGRKTIRIGDLITITVTSASLALVDVREWSDPLAPYVQGTHTATTRTLALSDSAQIVPISGASNTVAVTIPHTLYDAVLGRAFQTTLVALNVTNAITLAGSGGLTLTYYGSSTITAGDLIRISVESATVCRVEVIKTGAASGGTPAQIDYIRADGNWTKPAGAKSIWVRCVGTGGPGGGGPVQTGGTARVGGGGGGGGAVAEGTFDASLITSPVACLVPAAPTGGAGRVGSAGVGGAGTIAGPTSFGTYLHAYAGGNGGAGLNSGTVRSGGGGGGTGGAGAAGTSSAVAGGVPGASSATAVGGAGAQSPVTANGGLAEYGGGGGGGSSATPVTYAGGGSLYGGGAGGAGGGATAAGPTVVQPGAGGASGAYAAGGGGAAGTSGASATAGTDGADGDGMTKCGAGGGGGGSTVAANANGANGGDGGDWGGGGGGGGAGEGSGNGGNGGAGGLGGIIVITYF